MSLGGLCLVGSRPLAAQPAGDEQLLQQAKTALQQQKIPEMITACEQLRQQFPTSQRAVEATLMLCTAYRQTGEAVKAEAMVTEVLTRWPRTDQAWQAVEMSFADRTEADPKAALIWLAALEQRDGWPASFPRRADLPDDAHLRVLNLRWSYLAKAVPAQYLNETTTFLAETLKEGAAPELVWFAAKLARDLYVPLMREKRFDEVKTLSAQLQKRAVLAGLGTEALRLNFQAYFSALLDADRARYVTEIVPVMSAVQLAANYQEMRFQSENNIACFTALFQEGKRKEAHDVQQQMLAAFQRLGLDPQLYIKTREYYDSAALAGERKLLVEEIPAWLKTVPTPVPTSAIREVMQIIDHTYITFLQTDAPVDRFRAFHTQAQQVLGHPGSDPKWARDDLLNYCHQIVMNRPTLAPDEAMGFVPVLEGAGSSAEASRPCWLAQQCYAPMFASGRVADARTLHAKAQALLGRVGSPGQVAADNEVYYLQLAQTRPRDFLTEGWPYLTTQLDGASSIGQVRALCTLTSALYETVMTARTVEEGRTLHARVQQLLDRVQAPPELRAADRQAFLGALASASPEVCLAEWPALFKAAEQDKSPETLRTLTGQVGAVYAPLLRNGRVEDAAGLHQQVQTLVKKVGGPNAQPLLTADDQVWQAGLDQEFVTPLVWMIKRAALTKEMATAKQCLALLEKVVPDHPQTAAMRALLAR
jgi:hypothetical protein